MADAVIHPDPAHSERFCPQCGRSCLPLTVPHLSTNCGDCGRTVYFVRPGDNGEGIKIEAGERFTIPAGFIKVSLEPTRGAKLFRGGIPFLLHQFFLAGAPQQGGFREFVEKLEKEFDAHVETCTAAQGRDWVTQEDIEELTRRLNVDPHSRDLYMFNAGMFSGGVKWSIDHGDAERAAWAGYMLGTFRGLSIVTEPLFEETLWRGYLANEVVYEAVAAAGNKSPAQIEALKRLQPLFAQFDEATLSALVESGVPIGPKIGVKALPEELLRALAKYQLAVLERARQDAKEAERDRIEEHRHARKERREEIELRVKWASLGAAIATVLLGALALWLRADFSGNALRPSPPLGAASAASPAAASSAQPPASTTTRISKP